MTFKYVFDYQPGETFWCTADVGWITGHTYLIYGPLANGAKTILFEGVPNYPDTSRMSEVVDKHQVNILYTAPTAIRALMAKGDEAVKGTTRDSLRIMAQLANQLTQKPGNGITKLSVTSNHLSLTPGGRQKRAVS
ncbi:acetyl-coenzyme A synthetase [Vibrio variabilis]|uniref:Acetyl-coenzyme A synthetase n=1 Tax=Vibrio variabilis TaxID=990271 RepID=A0ABQ0JCD6_9VIBR|nr:acetyl-coenzyme A synthetase [Vibrio variabilis]